MKIVLKNIQISEDIRDKFKEQTAIVYGNDIVALFYLLSSMAKKNAKYKTITGIVNKEAILDEHLKIISKFSSLQALQISFLNLLKQPLVQLISLFDLQTKNNNIK